MFLPNAGMEVASGVSLLPSIMVDVYDLNGVHLYDLLHVVDKADNFQDPPAMAQSKSRSRRRTLYEGQRSFHSCCVTSPVARI